MTGDLTDEAIRTGEEFVRETIHQLYDLGYCLIKLDMAEVDRARAQGKGSILVEIELGEL